MLQALLDYLARCGIEFDTAINVLTGGQLGQTVSLRVATAARDGGKLARIVCWFLNWAVQPNHCALQFTTQPSPWTVYVRSAIAFTIGIAAAAGLIHIAFVGVKHFI